MKDSNEEILRLGNAGARDKHYPAVRYHATEEPQRVLNAEEDDALGDGWHDSPKKTVKKAKKADAAPDAPAAKPARVKKAKKADAPKPDDAAT